MDPSMVVDVHILSAFAVDGRANSGNLAGVVVLQEGSFPADRRLQALAKAVGLSETAFLLPDASVGPHFYHIRWFTPVTEVELCGHATLAAAGALQNLQSKSPSPPSSACFTFGTTRAGDLFVSFRNGRQWMNFPLLPIQAAEDASERLLTALGIERSRCRFFGRSSLDALLEVDSVEAVQSMKPDFALLKQAGLSRGIIVTAAVQAPDEDCADADFVSRFFAPLVGVDEDPVTGSAHCALAAYWSDHQSRLQKVAVGQEKDACLPSSSIAFVAAQLSKRRGKVFIRIEDNDGRVHLGGKVDLMHSEQRTL